MVNIKRNKGLTGLIGFNVRNWPNTCRRHVSVPVQVFYTFGAFWWKSANGQSTGGLASDFWVVMRFEYWLWRENLSLCAGQLGEVPKKMSYVDFLLTSLLPTNSLLMVALTCIIALLV